MIEFILFIFALFALLVALFTLPFALMHYIPLLFGKKVKALEKTVKVRYLLTLSIFSIYILTLVFESISSAMDDRKRVEYKSLVMDNLILFGDKLGAEFYTFSDEFGSTYPYTGIKIHFPRGSTIDGFLCDTSKDVFINPSTGALVACTLDEGNRIGGFLLPKGSKIIERTKSYTYKFDREDTLGVKYHWEINLLEDYDVKEVKLNGITYSYAKMRINKEKEIVWFDGNRKEEYWNNEKMMELLK